MVKIGQLSANVGLLLLGLMVDLSYGCNRRYWSNMIVTHFDNQVKPDCMGIGQPCLYDRNCCEGYECQMGVLEGGVGITTFCQSRYFYEDYEEFPGGQRWKDYQEMQSEEDDADSEVTLRKLRDRNNHLVVQLKNLKHMKAAAKKRELNTLKRQIERDEIRKLKEVKKYYEEDLQREMQRLRQRDEDDLLQELEKKNVNSTLTKERRISDLYMNLLNDVVEKENILHKAA